MKKIVTIILLFCAASVAAQNEQYLLIGTYTGGKSEGIYVYKFNTTTGDNSFVSVVKSSNPSFLAISPNQKYVYAVNENADSTKFTVGGNISAFSFDKTTGTLTELNKKPSGGKHPCFVEIDKTGQWVFAGNYTSGSIGLLHVNKDGSLDTLKQVIQHTGSGPDSVRQQGPHVHSTYLSENNNFLYVPDLGINKVMIYMFDNKKGKLYSPSEAISTLGKHKVELTGPRHMAFSQDGKYAYLIEELGGEISKYDVIEGGFYLYMRQRISAVSDNFKGSPGSADIHISPNGKYLYCSNRGDANTISRFMIDQRSGDLKFVDEQSTMGKTPRNFNFDPSGNFLLVANQNSDEIVIFKVNQLNGRLTDTGKRINVGNPVCLKWIK